MKTKVVKMLENNLNEEAIEEAAEVIKNGGLVAFPTETVYGLGQCFKSTVSKRYLRLRVGLKIIL